MAKATVEFEVAGNELHLVYRPRDDTSWVHDKFKHDQTLVIKGTFHLTAANLVEDDEPEPDTKLEDDPGAFEIEDRVLRFLVAKADGEYFTFDPDVLDVGVPVLLERRAQPTWKWFTAEERTSILAVVAQLRPRRIVIGGSAEDAIPVAEYERLVNQFPTGYELKRYVIARVGTVVRQFTDAPVDAEAMLRKYVDKRVTNEAGSFAAPFRETEVAKFQFLLDRLKEMLAHEKGYPERVWQAHILDIVRLLNPKYIAAFTSVPIKDFETGKRRQLDILLVDASGHVDVIEIKQPFGKCVMSGTPYRDNYVPLRELTGSIMQIEKYIFHLNRWGHSGDETLTRRFATKLPPGFRIRILNPCGIVIMGRDHDLSGDQRRDFEILRRQHKNVVDLITYDDLLRRLEFVLGQLKSGR